MKRMPEKTYREKEAPSYRAKNKTKHDQLPAAKSHLRRTKETALVVDAAVAAAVAAAVVPFHLEPMHAQIGSWNNHSQSWFKG